MRRWGACTLENWVAAEFWLEPYNFRHWYIFALFQLCTKTYSVYSYGMKNWLHLAFNWKVRRPPPPNSGGLNVIKQLTEKVFKQVKGLELFKSCVSIPKVFIWTHSMYSKQPMQVKLVIVGNISWRAKIKFCR